MVFHDPSSMLTANLLRTLTGRSQRPAGPCRECDAVALSFPVVLPGVRLTGSPPAGRRIRIACDEWCAVGEDLADRRESP